MALKIIILCLFFCCTALAMEQKLPLVITVENQFMHYHPCKIKEFCDAVLKQVTYHTKKRPDAPISLRMGGNMLGYHDATLDRSIPEQALHSLFQRLSQFPVTQLYLYFNSLITIPSTLATLRSLVNLNLSHNKLETVPLDLLELPHLEDINLSNNRITELPSPVKRIHPLIININTQQDNRIYGKPIYTLKQLPINLMLNPLITIICSLKQFGILHRNMKFTSPEQRLKYNTQYAELIKKISQTISQAENL